MEKNKMRSFGYEVVKFKGCEYGDAKIFKGKYTEK